VDIQKKKGMGEEMDMEKRYERGKKAFILNIPDPSIFGDLFSTCLSILHLILLRGLERIGRKGLNKTRG